MNWLVSSYADDRHPHELLHQAPAEPVHEAGVWYPVSDSLLKVAISSSSRECCWLWGPRTHPDRGESFDVSSVTTAAASWLMCRVSCSGNLQMLSPGSAVCPPVGSALAVLHAPHRTVEIQMLALLCMLADNLCALNLAVLPYSAMQMTGTSQICISSTFPFTESVYPEPRFGMALLAVIGQLNSNGSVGTAFAQKARDEPGPWRGGSSLKQQELLPSCISVLATAGLPDSSH